MTETTIFFSGVSLLLIWSSIVWLWRDFFVDDFRQSIFKMREELFLMAADDEISFDHPAYWMQRSAMNGMIRFAHRYSFTHFIVWTACVGESGNSIAAEHIARWDAALASLDEKPRKKILEMRKRMHMLFLAHSIKSSPIMMALVVPGAVALLLVYFAFEFVSSVFKGSLESVDVEAIVESENQQAFA